MNVPTPIDVTRSIAAGRAPVPSPIDWVQLGRAVQGAIAQGFVRVDHGHNPNWGSYTVTPEGHAAIDQG